MLVFCHEKTFCMWEIDVQINSFLNFQTKKYVYAPILLYITDAAFVSNFKALKSISLKTINLQLISKLILKCVCKMFVSTYHTYFPTQCNSVIFDMMIKKFYCVFKHDFIQNSSIYM